MSIEPVSKGLVNAYLESSKVDDAVDFGVSLEDLVEAVLLGDIDLDESGLLAADGLNAVQSLGRGVVQVISDDNLVVSLQQSQSGERANVARTTDAGLARIAMAGFQGTHTQ